jgi:hypothetical protein
MCVVGKQWESSENMNFWPYDAIVMPMCDFFLLHNVEDSAPTLVLCCSRCLSPWDIPYLPCYPLPFSLHYLCLAVFLHSIFHRQIEFTRTIIAELPATSIVEEFLNVSILL